MIKINASMWSIKVDHDGETTLVMKIPLSDSKKALDIPTNKGLIIYIKEGYVDQDGSETIEEE